ncbi:PQQ-dependent sugar dehydrogenase [Gracilibacillus timonensis]|uniref:PQQ-dependent sugar dehydrogenase n=1 Tax=Gracilibacillus timonensis TaxID=1816696 RepID=UPI000824D82D|nr:sorbosone dehydrogenase family protein [Gracilibacillus timonensis]
MRIFVYVLTILFLIGCSENPSQEQEDSQETPVNPETEAMSVESLADNLDTPWTIAKHEDTIYLTERPGAIVQIEDGQSVQQEVDLEKSISTASEAGFLGFTLAPDFAESQTAFAYYTYEEDGNAYNRIVSLQLTDDTWEEQRVLLDQIPSGNVHHGGRLAIGPDNKLYATTGDAAQPELAQDVQSLAGKILRLNLDGSIPEDNPFNDSYIYSYGHRNPQGLVWDSEDQLYATEHGNNANDEVNLIEAGQNYGWPHIEGEETQQDMEFPLFTSGTEVTWAPSGVDFYNDKLFVAALRGTALLEFDLDANTQQTFLEGYGRIRDIYIEDDELYFITNNTDGRGSPQADDDQLYRITLTE